MSTPILAITAVLALLMFFFLAVLLKPVRSLFLLLLRSAIGWAWLYISNMVLALIHIPIGINIASASIVGILGVPGWILLVLTKWIWG